MFFSLGQTHLAVFDFCKKTSVASLVVYHPGKAGFWVICVLLIRQVADTADGRGTHVSSLIPSGFGTWTGFLYTCQESVLLASENLDDDQSGNEVQIAQKEKR